MIELTADGSATLRDPRTGDTYHSMRGAAGEAMHIFIEHGLRRKITPGQRVNVLEVGFGTGLNAFLTLKESRAVQSMVYYEGLELYPVEIDVAAQLNYTDDPAFMALHSAPWGVEVEVGEHFLLKKRREDLVLCSFEPIFDLVYFDAFAPDTVPEQWTTEVFSRICDAMNPGGVLVTYSAKGSVRAKLIGAGFSVERLPGALGKRHMVRATKE